MNNSEIIMQLNEDLENDQELVFAKKDCELSKKHEKKIIYCLTEKAEELNNYGIFLNYSEWKSILLSVFEIISSHEFTLEGKEKGKRNNFIEKAIEISLKKEINLSEDTLNELEEDYNISK